MQCSICLSTSEDNFESPTCHHEFCRTCWKSWIMANAFPTRIKCMHRECNHWFDRSLLCGAAVEEDTAEQPFFQEQVIANAKNCISCSTSIEKIEGCDFISCPVCGLECCWVCGQPYTSDHTHDGVPNQIFFTPQRVINNTLLGLLVLVNIKIRLRQCQPLRWKDAKLLKILETTFNPGNDPNSKTIFENCLRSSENHAENWHYLIDRLTEICLYTFLYTTANHTYIPNVKKVTVCEFMAKTALMTRWTEKIRKESKIVHIKTVEQYFCQAINEICLLDFRDPIVKCIFALQQSH